MLAQAVIDVWCMMACDLVVYAGTMKDAAAFRVYSAEIKPSDAGKGNGRGTHGARFKRDVKVAVGQPFGSQHRRTLTDSQHFGVSGWIT